MSHVYSYSDFDGFQNSTIESLINIGDVIINLVNIGHLINFVMENLGLLVNFIHLLVLTKKLMRSNCINMILIGIGICDMLNLGYDLYLHLSALLSSNCSLPLTYILTLLDFWVPAFADNARRVRTWLIFLMAALRALIIKSGRNPKYSDINFVLKVIAIPFLISTLMSIFFWGRFEHVEQVWIPPAGCTQYTPGVSYKEYVPKIRYEFLHRDALPMRVFNLADGVLKLIPTLLFPVLTVMLVSELKKAEKSRQSLSGSMKTDKDHTTKLVIITTITFIAAEGPFGIIFFLEGIITSPAGLVDMLAKLLQFFEVFVVLNATSHFFICLLMSSPYRRTAKELFCCAKKQRMSTMLITGKSGISVQ